MKLILMYEVIYKAAYKMLTYKMLMKDEHG